MYYTKSHRNKNNNIKFILPFSNIHFKEDLIKNFVRNEYLKSNFVKY